MLVTILVITTAIASLFVLGFPVASLAAKRLRISHTSEQLWASAPLVGAGTILLVCQNLLYLDIPLGKSAIVLGTLAILGAAMVAARTVVVATVPWRLIGTGLAVYAVHASGLLVLGASNYYGYGWGDMYNYVSLAQLFVDHPYSSSLDTHDYLQTAHFYKLDRIGQSVLHAFIAAFSHTDAQQTFGATILLGPMLVFFSIFLLSGGLGIERRFAYPAAIVASLSPALASIHLEGFLSQAIAIPFLYLWPLAVRRLQAHPGFRSALLGGTLLAITAAIYTELVLPLVLSTVVALIVCHWLGRTNSSASVPKYRAWLSVFWWFGVMLGISVLANIGYFKSALFNMARTLNSNILDFIYPWAFQYEGLARLWIGHQHPAPSGAMLAFLVSVSCLTMVAGFGYALVLLRRSSVPATQVSTVLIICFPLAPLLLSVLTGNKYQYPFFKLLLIVWPLLLFLAASGLGELIFRRRGRAFVYFQLAVIGGCLALTNRIAYASTKEQTVARTARGGAHLLIDETFKQMRQAIAQPPTKRIYLWWYDKALWEGNWRARWLAYYARHNDVWSMNPTTPSGTPAPLRPLPLDVKVPAIGISWREVDIGNRRRIQSNADGKDAPWLYLLDSETDVRRLDKASRPVIDRSMRLVIDKGADPGRWYPLWVGGRKGAVIAVSAQFSGSGVSFRYDQAPYPPITNIPGGMCQGRELRVGLSFDQINHKLTVRCNGSLSQYALPEGLLSLNGSEPLGVTNLSGTPNYRYPLATKFPGRIMEMQTASIVRTMRLTVNREIDPNTWYPVWVAGRPDAATFLSVKFEKSGIRFRYDHWGYPAVIRRPGGPCSGTELEVRIQLDQDRKKMTVNCNGVAVEMPTVNAPTYLSWEDSVGVNNVVDVLEGKYPLARTFPGTVVEH